MCDAAHVNWIALEPDSALRGQAEELAAKKYSQAAYTRKR
jgi:hypothetical protein